MSVEFNLSTDWGFLVLLGLSRIGIGLSRYWVEVEVEVEIGI